MRKSSIVAIGALALGLAATAPAAAQDYYEAGYEYEQPAEAHEFARVRLGVSGVGGGHFANGPDIGMGGLQLRLGMQVGQIVGFYYMPTGLIGSIVDRPGSAGSVAGLLWNTGIVEVTLADMVQLGVGPSVDWIWGCSRDFQSEVACDSTDAYFGMHGRVAFVLGGHGPGRRGGVTLSGDVHPTFYDWDDPGLSVLGGLGFELY